MIALFLALAIFSQVIVDIDTKCKFVDPDLLITTSGLSKGQNYDPKLIADAIRKLYNLGLFDQITIDTTLIADGVYLTIDVVENPTLKGEPIFIGNKKFKNKTLREKVNLKAGENLSRKKIFDARQAIINLYQEKAYYLTTVRDSLGVPDSLNRSDLVFIIDEGQKVKIRHIEIEGNRSIPDKQIRKKMSNKAKSFFRSGKFKEDKFSEDLEAIVELYRERGFLDARVVKHELNRDANWLNIVITVEEGKRYYLGDIKFDGYVNVTLDALKKTVKQKKGEPYNVKKLRETVDEIRFLYMEDGYIYVQIGPDEKVNNDTVDITFQIVEGKPAHINKVIITGNEKTNEKVIRREIVSLPGAIFRRSEIMRSQRDIFNLGFFEDVKPDYRIANDQGDVDLIYAVKEKTVGSIGAGVSYSAQDKLTGYIEFMHPNIFGRGHRFSTKFEKGGRLTNIEAGYNIPWLFETRATAGADIYYTTRFWDYYYKQDRGGMLSLSHPLVLDYTRGYWTLKVERTRITNVDPAYQPPLGGYDIRNDTVPRIALIPGFSFVRDSRDYFFNPSQGTYINYSINNGFIFGDTAYRDYLKQTIETRLYLPVWWKFVLMAKGRLGVVESSKRVPVYERFFAGGTGPDGVRGYSDRSLGPHQGSINLGGKALFVNS
ncbi:MAG: outer membrane protein assembly factor BamA, partial [candidate division WOR-3 bacterium]